MVQPARVALSVLFVRSSPSSQPSDKKVSQLVVQVTLVFKSGVYIHPWPFTYTVYHTHF